MQEAQYYYMQSATPRFHRPQIYSVLLVQTLELTAAVNVQSNIMCQEN